MLSVIIITKNAEMTIRNSIQSVQGIADEIIIVDSFSEDQTVNVAQRLGAKIFQHQFKDFSDIRNYAMTKANGEWVFYLDADEQATPEFNKELANIVCSLNQKGVGGYFVKRKTYFYGKEWHLKDRVQRVFFKKNFVQWQGFVHETPIVEGKFLEMKNPLLHFTHQQISQMVDKTNTWSDFEANLRFQAHHPKVSWWRFLRVMATGFFVAYFKEKGFRNGTEGVIEAIYQSFSMFVTYAKLWEKQQKEK